MAATRLIAMHQNKGKSIAQSLKDRTEYAMNQDKTEQGELVSSYACDKETADQEFLLSKQEYLRITGRKPKGDILAWQIRQSFRPGEITAEEANRIGYETAMRFTKGNHAFIVATHTDRAHIHNHIIFNSTNLHCDRKFKDSWFIALALQKLSDRVCLEHCTSVIDPRKPGERSNKNPFKRESFRSRLREEIDRILESGTSRTENFQDLLEELKRAGYEVKTGKNTAVRGDGQERFIRFRSLGYGYTEEDLRRRIDGEFTLPQEENGEKPDSGRIHTSAQTQYSGRSGRDGNRQRKKRDFDLLIDINRKMQERKGKGYEHWAKIFNVKQMSKALLFLQENGIRDYEDLEEKAKASAAKFHDLNDAIREREQKLAEIAVLRTHLINYVKTRDIYTAYRKSGYSKKFLETHREAITLHKAAKAAFDELQVKKIPKVKDLSAEYSRILKEKRSLYDEYRQAKKEMMDYQIAKQNVDHFLKLDAEQLPKEKENTRKHTR